MVERICMYRVYELTEAEKGKITRCRAEIDTCYWDVFDSQDEADEEEERLKRVAKYYKKREV